MKYLSKYRRPFGYLTSLLWNVSYTATIGAPLFLRCSLCCLHVQSYQKQKRVSLTRNPVTEKVVAMLNGATTDLHGFKNRRKENCKTLVAVSGSANAVQGN